MFRQFTICMIVAALFSLLANNPASAAHRPPPGQRIISTAPSLTEIVFALGLERELVAVSDYCSYPPRAKQLPTMGGLLNPNLEAFIALRPTQVILLPYYQRLAEQLDKLAIPRLVVKNDQLKDIYDSIMNIGAHCRRGPAAKALATNLERSLLRLGNDLPAGASQKRVLLVTGRVPGSLRELNVASSSSYLGELLSLCGVTTLDSNGPARFPMVSKEEIVEYDPDIIIDLTFAGQSLKKPELAAARETWAQLASLKAIKHSQLYFPTEDYLLIPGPRLAKVGQVLREIIYPSSPKSDNETD
jgi:iron complex transport system substrate-binding protein